MTKKEYYKRHKKLWNEIVKSLTKSLPGSYHLDLKSDLFSRLWPKEYNSEASSCWACIYKDKLDPKSYSYGPVSLCKYGCLLANNSMHDRAVAHCLDGAYSLYIDALDSLFFKKRGIDYDLKEAIKWAKVIRDCPINPLS